MPEFVRKVYGPPGTGKTRALLGQMEQELEADVDPEHIAFVSFTRSAVQEARQRALGVLYRRGKGEAGLRHFQTFHALATRLLVPARSRWGKEFVTEKHRAHWCKHAGYGFQADVSDGQAGTLPDDDSTPAGNRLFTVDAWLSNMRLPVAMAQRAPVQLDGPPERTEAALIAWRRWKETHGLLDYGDLLERVLEERAVPPVRVLFVDEFQDLNPLQYAVYRLWAEAMEFVYIAGDDDQTIYGFQGASHRHLLHAPCTEEVTLVTSERLPSRVLAYANALIQGVQERKAKHVSPAKTGGEVVMLERPAPESLLRFPNPADTFVLARTNQQADRFGRLLQEQGIPYHPIAGPDTPGALWNRRLVHLARALRDLYRGGSVPYRAALALLDALPLHDASAGGGFVAPAKRIEFRKLPQRFPAMRTPLGEDLDQWTLAKLRPYFARVPSLQESLDAADVTSRQRDALTTHIRLRPAWPLLPRDDRGVERGIRVGTIHASKGRQAHTVILIADASRRGLERYDAHRSVADEETRVLYVGVTRAVERLVVVKPWVRQAAYPLPTPTGAA